jgi:DNA-binding response OmpR family regulator
VEYRRASDVILVAVADQVERDFIAAALAGWGYPAVAVNRADDALARYRRGDLAAVLIDRALLASDLPAWRDERETQPLVPLLFLAIAGDEDEIGRFGREEAGITLAPPYQLRALRTALRALVKEKEYV